MYTAAPHSGLRAARIFTLLTDGGDTPVLTTHRLSLPEVGGDAVAYTEPGADEIAVALSTLLDDAARRQSLATAALTRAREFTWAASAEAHLAAYARAAQSA